MSSVLRQYFHDPFEEVGDVQLYKSSDAYTDRLTLHEGRHSTVVSAWHTPTSQPVVMKTYNAATMKPRQMTNVRREIDILGRVLPKQGRCPGIVDMLAAFEDQDGQVVLVFKASLRGDLYQLMMREADRKLTEPLVASAIVLPMLKTLAHLHSLHIAHRDIKPENVFIDIDGHVNLGDFGLAILVHDGLTQRVGTLDYMAPEVLAMPTPHDLEQGKVVHSEPYTELVDIWGLGCLAYELLTGSPPFEVPDPKETAKLILGADVPALPGHLSSACGDFIRQALTKDPRHRPSARKLLEHPWMLHCQLPPPNANYVERSLPSGLPAIRSPSMMVSSGDSVSAGVSARSAGVGALPVSAVSPMGPKTPGRISDSSGPGPGQCTPRRTPSNSGLPGVLVGPAALKDLHDRQLHRRHKECTAASSGPKQHYAGYVPQQHSHYHHHQPQQQVQSPCMPVGAQPRPMPATVDAARNARVITDSPVASTRPSHSGQVSSSEHSGLSPTTPTSAAPSNAQKRAVQAARNLLNSFESDSFIMKDGSDPTDGDTVSAANSDCGEGSSLTCGEPGYSRLRSDLGQHSSSSSLDALQCGMQDSAPGAEDLGITSVAARCSSVTLPKTYRAAPDGMHRHNSCDGAVDGDHDSYGVSAAASAAAAAAGVGGLVAWQVQVQTPSRRPATSKSRFAR